MSVIAADEIKRRILEEKLVENYINLDTQLQPAGFDLTVNVVGVFKTDGAVDFDNSCRKNSEIDWVEPYLTLDTKKPFWHLGPGVYAMMFNERMNFPLDLMGDSFHRSSLMRCGVEVSYGRWDPGYCGMGRTLLIVHNPHGFTLYKDARVAQVKFFKVRGVKKGYNGQYQGEGKKTS